MLGRTLLANSDAVIYSRKGGISCPGHRLEMACHMKVDTHTSARLNNFQDIHPVLIGVHGWSPRILQQVLERAILTCVVEDGHSCGQRCWHLYSTFSSL